MFYHIIRVKSNKVQILLSTTNEIMARGIYARILDRECEANSCGAFHTFAYTILLEKDRKLTVAEIENEIVNTLNQYPKIVSGYINKGIPFVEEERCIGVVLYTPPEKIDVDNFNDYICYDLSGTSKLKNDLSGKQFSHIDAISFGKLTSDEAEIVVAHILAMIECEKTLTMSQLVTQLKRDTWLKSLKYIDITGK